MSQSCFPLTAEDFQLIISNWLFPYITLPQLHHILLPLWLRSKKKPDWFPLRTVIQRSQQLTCNLGGLVVRNVVHCPHRSDEDQICSRVRWGQENELLKDKCFPQKDERMVPSDYYSVGVRGVMFNTSQCTDFLHCLLFSPSGSDTPSPRHQTSHPHIIQTKQCFIQDVRGESFEADMMFIFY